MRYFFAVCLFLLSSVSHAALVSATSTVNYASLYNQYGTGDVHFTVATPAAGCESGFFINKADPGFQGNLLAIVLSKTQNFSVQVYGDTALRWAGSGANVCKVYTILLN